MQKKTELSEQQAVIEWCEYAAGKHPEFASIFHITNEGKRGKSYGAELVKAGLRRGVPDLCLPCARGIYHALYIEMKKDKTERPSPAQREWIERLNNQGNFAVVCCGADAAIRTLQQYIVLESGDEML